MRQLQGNEPAPRMATCLPRRRLGRTGITATALGLGGAHVGRPEVSDEEAVATICTALAQGIDYFDTSAGYGAGRSERRFGLALGGVPRDSYAISTKAGTHPDGQGDYSGDAIKRSVEASLKRLKMDRVDLLLLHDVSGHSPDGMDGAFAPAGGLDALQRLKEQGVIGGIGLGEKQFTYHRLAIESGRIDAILTYNNYTPLDVTAGDWLLPLAAQRDVGVLNGSPMALGFLIGRDPDELIADGYHLYSSGLRLLPGARRLYAWCREKGVPMGAIALQFPMRQPLIGITLTGAANVAELEENLRNATVSLPDSLWDELDALNLPVVAQLA